ncbi:MAG TPA: hypothetical protein VHG28_06585 [Longimicrobiaceae bacterium]|nr:hypothetical protein [Longimicrobiaceae bacterium]
MERNQYGERTPVSPGTPRTREEADRPDTPGPRRIDRPDQSEVQKGEDDGALGLTRTGQDG